ncbi:MAG: CaiB/BaiF CoA-transferase family protein [Rhodomicrobium sp.]
MEIDPAASTPLFGIRVIEFAGLGPAPYAGMLLADLGADVLRIERAHGSQLFTVENAAVDRGRRSLALDLKDTAAVDLSLRVIEKADVLIEGFRPGVMERLGLGPETALDRNPRLIYGRMTGWGQEGPLASAAGHDLTYLALTGALEAIGPEAGPPVPPLNVAGDMGGGGTFLVIGILAALLERQRSGLGQVIDAAILDGTVSQLAIILGMRAGGLWGGSRGQNILDGGAPFYRTYRCLDGKFIAVAALEPKFFAALSEGLGLDAAKLAPAQYDRTGWPALHQEFEAIFATKTRDEWASHFEAADACVAPVLNFDEAARHPHNAMRSTFMEVDGNLQPPPAPRFSRSITSLLGHSAPGEGGEDALKEWGIAF